MFPIIEYHAYSCSSEGAFGSMVERFKLNELLKSSASRVLTKSCKRMDRLLFGGTLVIGLITEPLGFVQDA